MGKRIGLSSCCDRSVVAGCAIVGTTAHPKRRDRRLELLPAGPDRVLPIAHEVRGRVRINTPSPDAHPPSRGVRMTQTGPTGEGATVDHVARAEVLVGAPPERVWEVLTGPEPRPEIMFGARTSTDWVPGHRITWSGEWQGHAFEDHGEVVDVEPGRRLVVTHFSPMSGLPDVPESYHRLEYVVEPVDGGTRVVLEQDNNPTEESARHSAENWQAMLDGVKTVAEGASA